MTKAIAWLAADQTRSGRWFPLGELMAGLMMSFILVAVVTVSRLDVGHYPRPVTARAGTAPRVASQMATARRPTLRDQMASDLSTIETAASRTMRQQEAATGPALRDVAASGLTLLQRATFRSPPPEAVVPDPALRDALAAEFAPDLKRWHARVAPDLSVRFDEPELLFAGGKPALTRDFKRVLSDFFPRYLRVLSDPRFAGRIEALSIETHEASLGGGAGAEEYASLRDMALSERRTQATLSTVLLLPETASRRAWLAQKLAVEDLPSSEAMVTGDDVDARHCVAFRVRTVGVVAS
jgi:outer membrane protein OmpA-like peptidoglycan-associated protein